MTKHHKFNAHTLWLREAWIYEYATFPEKKPPGHMSQTLSMVIGLMVPTPR